MRKILLSLLLALSAPLFASDPAAPQESRLKGHVAFLASDALRGREPGTPEFSVAAEYVAAQFLSLGLRPVGDDGSYLQRVPLVSTKLMDKGAVTLTSPKGDIPLTFGDEFFLFPNYTKAEFKLDAPMVFVGFGVVAPEYKHDDYAGIDVKGKIVVYLSGAPKSFPTDQRAHYSIGDTKALAAAERGAIATLVVETPTSAEKFPIARYANTWAKERMAWRQSDGSAFLLGAGAQRLGIISLKAAEKLFANRSGGATAVMKAAETPQGRVKGGPLGRNGRFRINSIITAVESSNVVGMIEGNDPSLKTETIVLSAHLDHVGVGEPVKGDAIYNGAMDNAVGIASMIEVARDIINAGDKPKRSILFLATTAEEKGLVGADYFVHHPTVPNASMVANVNLDMPIITYDFEDVVAFGSEHSTIGTIVGNAATRIGVKLSPDPDPDEILFVRGDQYSFVKKGVPSVFLVTGYSGPGKAASEAFLATHYHMPTDDLAVPIRWDAGAKFVKLNLEIARGLANAPERPRWNKGDFFGMLYNGYGAR